MTAPRDTGSEPQTEAGREMYGFLEVGLDRLAHERAKAIAALRAALLAAPPAEGAPVICTNCRHPYSEHTGRTLTPSPWPRLPSGLGPPELRLGQCCEHLEDAFHTCACPCFFAPPAEVAPK